MTNALSCPKCQEKMQEGFVPDYTYTAIVPSEWVEGPREKSFWFGTTVTGKTKYLISAFRCKKCGYLELYANADDLPEA